MRRECPGRFLRHELQRKPLVSDPNIHHRTCVTHVPDACRDRWPAVAGKRSRHSWRMHSPQFCVSGKKPMDKSITRIPTWTAANFDICLGGPGDIYCEHLKKFDCVTTRLYCFVSPMTKNARYLIQEFLEAIPLAKYDEICLSGDQVFSVDVQNSINVFW